MATFCVQKTTVAICYVEADSAEEAKEESIDNALDFDEVESTYEVTT